MPNIVEVEIQGRDATQAAFASSTRGLKTLGQTFNQVGNIASAFGNQQLAIVIDQLGASASAAGQLERQLNRSKLAMVAIGAAAVTAGYAIGNSIRKYIPFFNEPDILEKAASIQEKIQSVANQRLAVRDPNAAAAKAQRDALLGQAGAIENQFGPFGMRIQMTKEETELAFQLRQLAAEKDIKLEEDKNREIGRMTRDANNEKLVLLDEFSGRVAQETARFNDQRDEIERNAMLSQEQRQSLIEINYRAHQLRLSKIHQDAQDKIVQDEKSAVQQRQLVQDVYLTSTSQVLGAIATIAQTQGKKGFAMYKAFAIAQAIIDTYKSANAAYSALAGIPIVGPTLAAVAAAGAIAAGLANVAVIAAQKPPQAHSGLDYVPQDATYVLKRGEMVLDPGTSEQVRNAATTGGGGTIHLTINMDGNQIYKGVSQASRDGRLTISARAVA